MTFYVFTCKTGTNIGQTLWDAALALPGPEADILRLKIHSNITIQQLKIKTSMEATQNQPNFYGGHKFCDVIGRGNDVISYSCKCKRPHKCKWVYVEVNQAQPGSVYEVCEAIVT